MTKSHLEGLFERYLLQQDLAKRCELLPAENNSLYSFQMQHVCFILDYLKSLVYLRTERFDLMFLWL